MNNRRRNFRSRPQKNNFRRRNGSLNNTNTNNFNNGNIGFSRNGSMNNIHSVEKAMIKFQQLAKDAQSNGDPILAQNYLQHADHFSRILTLQEINKLSNNNVIEQNFKNNSDLTDLNKNTKQDTGEILEKD